MFYNNPVEIFPCSELFAEPPSELMRFLWKCYEGKVTSNLHGPDERITRAIGLRHGHAAGALIAASLLEKSRIMALAITPDDTIGSRFSIGRELLRATYSDNTAAWTSIGESHKNAHDLVAANGMQRVNDPEIITALFDNLDRPKDYRIEAAEGDSLLVVNGPSSSRPDYRQQVWAWEDRIGAPER